MCLDKMVHISTTTHAINLLSRIRYSAQEHSRLRENRRHLTLESLCSWSHDNHVIQAACITLTAAAVLLVGMVTVCGPPSYYPLILLD